MISFGTIGMFVTLTLDLCQLNLFKVEGIGRFTRISYPNEFVTIPGGGLEDGISN